MWQIILAVIYGGIIGSCITFVIMSCLNTKVGTPSASHNKQSTPCPDCGDPSAYLVQYCENKKCGRYQWG